VHTDEKCPILYIWHNKFTYLNGIEIEVYSLLAAMAICYFLERLEPYYSCPTAFSSVQPDIQSALLRALIMGASSKNCE